MKETYEFEQALDGLLKAHSQLPNKIAAETIAFVNQRFKEENWVDTYTEAWKPRKEDRGRRRRNRRQRAILTKSGRLKRSIRKIVANTEEVVIGTDVPYAQVHNEGSRETVDVRTHQRNTYKKTKEEYTTRKGTTRNRTRKEVDSTRYVASYKRRMNIPRRQYIGPSAVLTQRLERLVTSEYMKVLKNGLK